jgi:hypothetical protein
MAPKKATFRRQARAAATTGPVGLPFTLRRKESKLWRLTENVATIAEKVAIWIVNPTAMQDTR